MNEGEVVDYIRQVCEGLCHMHEHNIVHLDIKVRPALSDSSYSVNSFVTKHFFFSILLSSLVLVDYNYGVKIPYDISTQNLIYNKLSNVSTSRDI